MVDAFWNVADSEDYNVYHVCQWIWEMRRLGVQEVLEDEITTTWPRQQHGWPNELNHILEIQDASQSGCLYHGTRASNDGLSCSGG